MRIRKHARVLPPSPSPPSIAAEEVPSTAVCELNRSPWDVIAFHEYQIEINDDHTHNGVDKESYCSHDSSFDSLKAKFWEDVAKKSENEEIKDEEDDEDEDDTMLLVHVVKDKLKKKLKLKKEKEMNYIRCGKTDGKGWNCKHWAKEGYPLCEHHLTQLESYKYNQSNCPRKPSEVESNKRAALKTTSRNKKRRRGRITSDSPAEFYYYSGFGPSWGRRRGEGNEIKSEQLQVVDAYVNDHEASSSSLVHALSDQDQEADWYIDDDFSDDSDDDNVVKDNGGGEKRIRKRIKARSLKSIL